MFTKPLTFPAMNAVFLGAVLAGICFLRVDERAAGLTEDSGDSGFAEDMGLAEAALPKPAPKPPAISANGRTQAATASVRSEGISASGRTEALSEEVRLGSRVPGRIARILVCEGERVAPGQVVAELEGDEQRARVDLARAEVDKAQAALDLVLGGARRQEREAARAAADEAKAAAEGAEAAHDRVRDLYASGGLVSASELDAVRRDWQIASAREEAARLRLDLVNAPPRSEQVAGAEAEVRLARARLAEAEALFQGTIVRSPLDGMVLRVFRWPGESVPGQAGTNDILSVADVSRIRVRAEVDETDVSKVRVGQEASVRADAYGDRVFPGRVARVGRIMGPKRTAAPEPTDKVDTEVLETLVELESEAAAQLPLGLRVEVTLHPAQ